MTKPKIQLILSLIFLNVSLVVYGQVNSYFNPVVASEGTLEVCQAVEPTLVCQQPQPSVCTRDVAPLSLAVEGVWEQYSIENGERIFMARLDIRKQGDAFIADPLSLSANTFPKHAYRSFAHSYEDGLWTFCEDWDNGQIGEFTLELQDNGEFYGSASLADSGASFETVFVKVSE